MGFYDNYEGFKTLIICKNIIKIIYGGNIILLIFHVEV